MSTVPSPAASWSEVLDELEAELDGLDAALSAGRGPATAPWLPPRDLGPVPGHLHARAGRLLTRFTTAIEHLTEERDAVAAAGDDTAQRRAAAAAYDAW